MKVDIKLPTNTRGRKSAEQRLLFDTQVKDFADKLMKIQQEIAGGSFISESDKISARGWAYQLEGFGVITKDQFNYCGTLINDCRKKGLLPIDFTAQDSARDFFNVESLTKDKAHPINYLNGYLRWVKNCDTSKDDVAFWESQEYYIQMMVEKIDVRNLFHDICKKYHIPIANARGWGDLNSRNNLVMRFKEAEEMGLKPVFLYYGDFDPAGIKIVETIKKNIRDIEKATKWSPDNLIVDHFGLKIDFIEANKILWIDNLMTGGGRNLGKLYEKHKAGTLLEGRLLKYELEYIEKYGARKCEANAILPIRQVAIDHCEKTIQKYLGENPFEVYDKKILGYQKEVFNLMEKVDYKNKIQNLIDDLKNTNQD